MKKIAVIQLDGVSYPLLSDALVTGSMPFVASLVAQGYQYKQIFSGLPSTTPASQYRLFYGKNDVMINFRMFDKKSGSIIHPLAQNELKKMEDTYAPLSTTPLFKGGATINALFRGLAVQSISSISLKTDVQSLLLLLKYFLNPFLFFPFLTKIFMLYQIEKMEQRVFGARYKDASIKHDNIYQRIVHELLLGDIGLYVYRDLLRKGINSAYINFSGYDHLAHHFGPDSSFSRFFLSVIDSQLRRIVEDPAIEKQNYTYIVLSDHGQTQAVPFVEFTGSWLADILQKHYPEKKIIDERKEHHKSVHQSADLFVLSTGGWCTMYGKSLPTGSSKDDIQTKFPGFFDILSKQKGVGVVIYRENEALYFADQKATFPLADLVDHPLVRFETKEVRSQIISYIREVMGGIYQPDVLVIGQVLDASHVVNFEYAYGSHGSWGGNQSKSFLLSNNPSVIEAIDLTSVNKIAYSLLTTGG